MQPARCLVLKTTSRDQGSEPSNATIIPQMTVVAELTCSEDWLSSKPGFAVGDCHALKLSRVQFAVRTSVQHNLRLPGGFGGWEKSGAAAVPKFSHLCRPKGPQTPQSQQCNEGAETHRALRRAHRAHQRMQRFSAMYTLSEGGQGRGENTLTPPCCSPPQGRRSPTTPWGLVTK